MNLQSILESKPQSKADIYKPALLPIRAGGAGLEFLLIESKREPGTYKTAGGRLESEETIGECISRELEEELRPKWFKIISHVYSSGIQKAIDEDFSVELDFFLVILGDFDFDYDENKDFVWAKQEDMLSGIYKVSDSMVNAVKKVN